MERRRYRNLLNQPLPVELFSDSLSVPAKGYFYVEEPDFDSPELRRLRNAKQIRLIETLIRVVEKEAAKLPESPPLPSHGEEPEEGTTKHMGDVGETSVEDKSSVVTDDSLTSSTGMMESISNDDEEGADIGNVNDDSSGKKKSKRKPGRMKKTASRDKPRS